MILLLVSISVTNLGRNTCPSRVHRKCTGVIFWNFWIRLLIQGCLELTISSVIYLLARKTLIDDLGGSYSMFFFCNDFFSYTSVGVFCLMPIFYLVFYCLKFNKMGDKDFKASWGSTLTGLKTNKRSVIFFPIFFILRRIAFTCMAFWLTEYPACFILILIGLTMVEAIYLLMYKPFETPLL